MEKENTYMTVRQFSKAHPAFSESALRYMIFMSEPRKSSKEDLPSNGMKEAGVIIRLGRRVLIDEHKFFEWLAAQ